MTSLALVDDHACFRDVMHLMLSRDFRVVGEAGDAPSAQALIGAAAPDVVLLDLHLPGSDGFSIADWARSAGVRSKMLVVSMLTEEHHVARALRSGAHGYVFKHQSHAELVDAIHTVARGGTYFAPGLAIAEHQRLAAALQSLTWREREVFDHTVRGETTKRTAAALCLSPRTIETHRARIFAKFGAASVVELTRIAARLGVLPE